MTRNDRSKRFLIGGICLNKTKIGGGEGRLPAVAHLAYPYVPFQMEDPPQYEPRKALVRGTLFSGLDFPFMGMVNENEQPVNDLTNLQTVGFAIQELALYLDTHQDDREALELYHRFQKLYTQARAEYESQCGPLNHLSQSSGDGYQWLKEPWPWEYANNREE